MMLRSALAHATTPPMRLPDSTSLRRLPSRDIVAPAMDEAEEKYTNEAIVTYSNICPGHHDWITLFNSFGT